MESRTNGKKSKHRDEGSSGGPALSSSSGGLVSPPWRPDDKDGHYVFEVGENLSPRYKILGKMGKGTFGRVLHCWDREKQEHVAVKIIRSVQQCSAEAMIEIDILRTLANHEKNGLRGCVQFKNWFQYRNHVCIVCEKLGPSLDDFLNANDCRPCSLEIVRELARHLLEGVASIHDLTLAHTDLKPQNILLVSSKYRKVPVKNSPHRKKLYNCIPTSLAVKIIDFGGATFEEEHHSSLVSTRQYRAPEVIMGLGWSYPCDLWSVGCILVELCTGNILFGTHEDLEHLAMMERMLGPIPRSMIKGADQSVRKYFRNGRELNWPEGAASRRSVRAVRSLPRLRNLITQNMGRNSSRSLIELLHGLLKFDPNKRLSAKEALEHHFFTAQ